MEDRDFVIILDDGTTFGYLSGASILQVPGDLKGAELAKYVEANKQWTEPVNIVEDGETIMIIQRIDRE